MSLSLTLPQPGTGLYASHALSRWGSRMWEFASVLLLLHVSSGSLRLVALHGILQAGTVALLGPRAGKLVDHTERRRLLTSSILAQNAALISAALMAGMLTLAPGKVDESGSPQFPGLSMLSGMERALTEGLFTLEVAVLLLLSCGASVAALCRNLAVHRDWVVILADSLARRSAADGNQTPRGADSARDEREAADTGQVRLMGRSWDETRKSTVSSEAQKSDGLSPRRDSFLAGGNGHLDKGASTGTGTHAGAPARGPATQERKEDHQAPDVATIPVTREEPTVEDGSKGFTLGNSEGGASEAERTLLLGAMNASLTRIDLVCRLVAPAMMGLLMTLLSLPALCLAVASWNALSLPLEVWLAEGVYRSTPELRGCPCAAGTGLLSCRCFDHNAVSQPEGDLEHSDEAPSEGLDAARDGGREDKEALLVAAAPDSSAKHHSANMSCSLVELTARCERVQGRTQAWCGEASALMWVYVKQASLPVGLALAVLYFNVLSFGDLMTAYLKAEGVPVLLLGMLSAMAALTGLLGTYLFPVLLRRHGLLRTAGVASLLQWGCLLPAGVAAALAWRGSHVVSPWLLMACVVLSRVGLWMLDIAALQIVQESVPAEERGQVGGVQAALQQAFQVQSFVLCAVIADPENFWIAVLLSFAMVTGSALLVQLYSCSARVEM